MADFHNPYHFVPVQGRARPGDDLSTERFEAGDVGHVTHDRFLAATVAGGHRRPVYSGRILCRLTTEDPTVVGADRRPAADGEGPAEDRVSVVAPFEIRGAPAIPATTLRGLIGAIAEAASDSALRVLSDRAFSYRAAMKHSLPALGMIVFQGNEPHLRPLALPHLDWNEHNLTAAVPPQYATMFPDPRLKVYVDGYRPRGRDAVEFERGSFLDRSRPASYSADHREYWYLKLAGSCTLESGLVKATHPHVKAGAHPMLLGRRALPGQRPIPEDEYAGLPPHEQAAYTRGILRVLGIAGRESQMPTTKKHEIFIAVPVGSETSATFPIAQEAWNRFHTLADERTEADPDLPYELEGASRAGPNQTVRLREGDLVFFRPDEADPGTVAELAISSIWRRWAGHCHAYFAAISPEVLPFHGDRTRITIAEQLFGFVAVSRAPRAADTKAALALASRLRFSPGRLDSAADPADLANPYAPAVTLKILSSPKPPCPPLYFQEKGGRHERFIAKDALDPAHHEPQGRKFYVHRHAGTSQPWKSHPRHESESANQKSRVTPLKAGLEFLFHVDFENLSRRELSLLCYALRPSDPFRHKLGMGKAIGLGKVRIDPIGLLYIDRFRRYSTRDSDLFAAPRYHRVRLEAIAEGTEARAKVLKSWPDCYVREARDAAPDSAHAPDDGFATATELREEFRSDPAGDPVILKALELIGNPSKVKWPVHAPQMAGVPAEDMEAEAFRWFMDNELRARKEKDARFMRDLPPEVRAQIHPQSLPSLASWPGNHLPGLERRHVLE